MSLRILLVIFVASCVTQTSLSSKTLAANQAAAQGGVFAFIVEANGNGNSPSMTPAERLEKSVEVAKKGDINRAFELVQESKNLEPNNPLYSVEYINTLLAIVEHSSSSQRGKIVNEAIKTVNGLKSNTNFDGRNNPETAYHFMVSVGKLANVTLPLSEATGISLYSCAGTIARNLRTNPQFPANGKESLAEPIVGLATALAVQKDQAGTFQAITEACELGFSGFKKLSENPLLRRLDDQPAFAAHLDKLETAYLVKVKQWSEQAVADFQPFGFRFNMDDVEGGSLANRDFEGKILVVDFWATWCPPCREEIPHFIELQNKLESSDVQVLGISMDSPENPQSATKTVKKFLSDNNVNYPCGLGTPELKKRVPGDMKLPTTLFIDRSGTVRYMANGYHDYAKLEAIAKVLANEEQPVMASPSRH